MATTDEDIEPDQPRAAGAVSGADYMRDNMPHMRRIVANGVELEAWRAEAWAVRRPDHLDLIPPPGFRDPVTGRRELAPDPGLVLIGRYLRRARRYAGKSQQRVASDAGLSQSMVSRAERGLAPGMGFGRFVAMCEALGRLFPLGACPHEHECAWTPIKPPERQVTDVGRLLELILKTGGGD